MDAITGGCLCGSLRYAVAAAPTNPHFCTCRQCQRWSGAPVVAWVVPALLHGVTVSLDSLRNPAPLVPMLPALLRLPAVIVIPVGAVSNSKVKGAPSGSIARIP